jgi:DNA-binding MarR family transcriptional regulator
MPKTNYRDMEDAIASAFAIEKIAEESPKSKSEDEPIRSNIKRTKSKRIINKRSHFEHNELQPIALDDRYYKTDNDVEDCLMPTLSTNEQCVYRYLYRESYGWGDCICQLGYKDIQSHVGIKSRATLGKTIDRLLDKGYVEVIKGKGPRSARIYRVLLPCEIESLKGKSIRSTFKRISNERSNSNPLYVQKIDINTPKLERSNSKRIDKTGRSSRDYSAANKSKIASKDNKDTNKDNTKNALAMLLSLNIHDDKAAALAAQISCEQLEMLIAFTYDPEMNIKNKPGWIIRAIEEGYALPDDWVRTHTAKEQRKKQETLEQQRVIAERKAFEQWIDSITDDTKGEAIEYANKEMANLKIEIKEEVVRSKMWMGFYQEYLEQKFEKERDANYNQG